MENENIIEHDNYKIDYYNISSNSTFIVFNGYGSNKKSKPFGLLFLINLGFNVISVLQDNNQYQGLSFEDFEFYVAKYVKNKNVFLYGSSLGAYAAIYYAGAVNGTVIAAAPRNSAHPIMNSTSENFKDVKFLHKDISANQKTCQLVYVFIDPLNDVDMFFLKNVIYSSYPNLILLPFKFAGHEVLYHLNKTNQLKNIISEIVDGKMPAVDVNVESICTDLGRAKYYLDNSKRELCLSYINRVANSKDLDDRVRLLINDIIKKYNENFNQSIKLI
ncbi:hypothetical protein ABEF89_00505 [Acinetobacter thermotolerans]|uniref:hypothetical protein n=1 Tax=Acinetobacter thermotolerans TaxID=3151487 RepID=UPI00325B3E71